MSTQQIFISYSSADHSWARDFAQALHRFDADVWLDDFRIKPGDSISDLFEKGLRGSDIVVLLINQENLVQPNLFFEFGAASAMNKKIVPIVSEEVPASELPAGILNRKYLIRKSPERPRES
jgi:hypothetical protein